MKKIIALALSAALAISVLAGCGSSKGEQQENTKTPEEMTEIYVDALEGALDPEMLQINPVLSDAEDGDAPLILDVLGLKADQMQAFGLSVSMMNIMAYGVAAVLPAEGQEEAVMEALNGFVDRQKQGFEHYLEDQYVIAKAAKVEKLEDGTLLLVMCEDQDTVFEKISGTILGK